MPRSNGRKLSTDGSESAPVKPLEPVPKMVALFNGPISRYLAMTGKTMDEFRFALEDSVPNAVTLFAAEVVFAEVQRMADAIREIEVRKATDPADF